MFYFHFILWKLYVGSMLVVCDHRTCVCVAGACETSYYLWQHTFCTTRLTYLMCLMVHLKFYCTKALNKRLFRSWVRIDFIPWLTNETVFNRMMLFYYLRGCSISQKVYTWIQLWILREYHNYTCWILHGAILPIKWGSGLRRRRRELWVWNKS